MNIRDFAGPGVLQSPFSRVGRLSAEQMIADDKEQDDEQDGKQDTS